MAESDKEIDKEELERSIKMLETLSERGELLDALPEALRVDLLKAAGKLSRPDRNEYRLRKKQAKKEKRKQVVTNDRKARALSGIRSARETPVFEAPKQLLLQNIPATDDRVLSSPRNCYVCKKEYTKLHHFYDAMCEECGDLNYMKRFQRADMTGQVVLITGSRLKIGYHICLMMLRSGATVIATTRFPVDSANRFAREEDYHDWKERLHIHGLDLRHIPSVELFASYVEQNFDRLDVIINNAAQTVRRPPGFYSHMMEKELLPYEQQSKEAQVLLKDHHACVRDLTDYGKALENNDGAMPVTWHGQEPGVGIRASAKLSQIPYRFDNSLEAAEIFPEGELDADLQQVDLRKTNSWRLRLGEVQTAEMLEVQLVNSVAPFVLINNLIGLMRKDYTGQKHIINVSAMEGKFHRFKKEDRHPHTNMAKAALNMMTHTSASDFAKDGIYMNAVDTGWVTDEDPVELAKKKEELHDFQPPLDIVDGAARVVDPLLDGINSGKHWCGKFLKDYFPIDW
ncbi:MULTISPECIES: SDR family NAD(P)-dependent oxidoreductase [Reichenbachiella]|uniref:Short chain dehydrogenase n=1 Tax=Reichenbachiella agariperforans TaxID=156994 RepID=A0A1M6UYD6_REIAG|nr:MULTISPECIES: SDR family oxidoreductase [Reichenbachiella]MBU2912423.1 SDR family oxidoreductase [Reichenbachiella agariperforans]RJE72707.1 oxidoreductase [Reichenbachiella sp. MSK19-1]SHK74200.1 short chain dehydrogenase [Reichenbachiella agariperforans]